MEAMSSHPARNQHPGRRIRRAPPRSHATNESVYRTAHAILLYQRIYAYSMPSFQRVPASLSLLLPLCFPLSLLPSPFLYVRTPNIPSFLSPSLHVKPNTTYPRALQIQKMQSAASIRTLRPCKAETRRQRRHRESAAGRAYKGKT
ncbi:hypothetical protein AB1N83_013486 [Pleurotus pulmonarius]